METRGRTGCLRDNCSYINRGERSGRPQVAPHHLTIDLLRESYYALKRKAAPVVDGVSGQQYEQGLEERLVEPIRTRSLPQDRSGWSPPPAPFACESLRPYLFPLPAFIKKKGTGTEPMPFVALWLR
jgi:hypothetical protein